jgi:hypothetical protein
MKSKFAKRLGMDLDLQVFARDADYADVYRRHRWFLGVEIPLGVGSGTMIVEESLFSYTSREAAEKALAAGGVPLMNEAIAPSGLREVALLVAKLQ